MGRTIRKIASYKSVLALVLVSVLTACASHSDKGLKLQVDGPFDLSPYASFDLRTPEIINPETNAFFDSILKRKFQEKGLMYRPGRADLQVVYQLVTLEKQRLELETTNKYGAEQTLPKYVAEFYGGLLLQIVDIKANKVVWKAIAGRNTTNDKSKLNTERISQNLDIVLEPLSR